MIALTPRHPCCSAERFPARGPGPMVMAEHTRLAGTGCWWVDRLLQPRVVAVTCAGHTVVRGDPRATGPEALAPLAHTYIDAPARFLPVLRAAFVSLVPWERMVSVQTEPARAVRPPGGAVVRRMTAGDGSAVADLDGDMAWIAASWGGPARLATSGHCWGAFRGEQLLSLACTYFLGGLYEDLAVATRPAERRRGLALACVTALCGDISARGRTATWNCSRDNGASRRLAWSAGFRLADEYVHYAVGKALEGSEAGRGVVPVAGRPGPVGDARTAGAGDSRGG
ncbi:GNAT family N-acetyltransferase [Streptomyces sp. NPDC048639]|uniref:GNAT family N-acetyltransferase n=1 Tax=Streptomyces sp. NPDC048639 TaxID=3365581 RepID=UPI00371E31B7